MSNYKYTQTSTLMSGPVWLGGRINAWLLSGAVYNKTHTLISQVRVGATLKNVTDIPNLGVGGEGQAFGSAAQFAVTPKGGPYQLILTWDQNLGDQRVLIFCDEDGVGNPIALENNGTLIVRPQDYDPSTGLGTWFLF